MLLDLDERAVGDRHLAAAHAHGDRGLRRLQGLGHQEVAGGRQRRVMGQRFPVESVLLGLGKCIDRLAVQPDGAEEFHRPRPFGWGCRLPMSNGASPEIDTAGELPKIFFPSVDPAGSPLDQPVQRRQGGAQTGRNGS